jgi:hypothetical protein
MNPADSPSSAQGADFVAVQRYATLPVAKQPVKIETPKQR